MALIEVLSGIAYLNHVYQYRANTCTIGQNIAQTKQYVYYRKINTR